LTESIGVSTPAPSAVIPLIVTQLGLDRRESDQAESASAFNGLLSSGDVELAVKALGVQSPRAALLTDATGLGLMILLGAGLFGFCARTFRPA